MSGPLTSLPNGQPPWSSGAARHRRLASGLLGVALVLALVDRNLAQTSQAETRPAASTAAQGQKSHVDELRSGEDALERRQLLSARAAFARANALRNQMSPEAWFGLARVAFISNILGEAVRHSDQALKYVGGDFHLEARIRQQRGLALIDLAISPDDERLVEAAGDLARARRLDPALLSASYHRGRALMASYRDAEGQQELRRYLRVAGSLAEPDARHLIAEPRRARQRFAAPDFSVRTDDGQTLTLTELRGTVVFLDFWGTWCLPCRADTPALVQLHRRYAKEPFLMIGVAHGEPSVDVWRQYIAEHQMTWPQVLDTNGGREVLQLLKGQGVPDYVLIDPEGIIRARRGFFGAEWRRNGAIAFETEIIRALAMTKRPSSLLNGRIP